jgi:hypothetical protein
MKVCGWYRSVMSRAERERACGRAQVGERPGERVGRFACMTTSPSEPVDNPQLPDDAETDDDQDSEPTSTAPAENNPTVPDPPD